MLERPEPLETISEVEDWVGAQRHANFVLLRPRPTSSWKASEVTIRGESARHYSSLRFLVTRGSQKVRVKQTFNDWWVPVANDFNLRRVQSSTVVGDEIIFLGKDYHGRPGACAQILGTTCEAFVKDGELSPDDWSQLFGDLGAAVEGIVAEARRTSFAQRSYWMRWKRDVGPWDSWEFTKPHWMSPESTNFERVSWASTPDRWSTMPGAPDSIAILEGEKSREIQVLFRSPMTLNYTSWLRIAQPSDAARPIAPGDPRYPPLDREVEFDGRVLRYAGLVGEHGPWFFYWQNGNRAYELHLRANRAVGQKGALEHAKRVAAAESWAGTTQHKYSTS